LIPNSQDVDLDALNYDWSIAEITKDGMILNLQFWDPKLHIDSVRKDQIEIVF